MTHALPCLYLVILVQAFAAIEVKAYPFRDYSDQYVFARQGSPYYGGGFHDTQRKLKRILSRPVADSSKLRRARGAAVESFHYLRSALRGGRPSNSETRCWAIANTLFYLNDAHRQAQVEHGMFTSIWSGLRASGLQEVGWSKSRNRLRKIEVPIFFGFLVQENDGCTGGNRKVIEKGICIMSRDLIARGLRRAGLIIEETRGGAYVVKPTLLSELSNHPETKLDSVSMSDVLDACSRADVLDDSNWVQAAAYSAIAYHAGDKRLASKLFSQSQ